MKVNFYKHDSYLEMRRKFTGAWANLRLELHEMSPRFYKEGEDEFETDTRFFSLETANELLFTLTGETIIAAARRLFAKSYSYRGKPGDWVEANILGNFPDVISYPSEIETLDEANNSFVLPFNKFNYAEFKRRFAGRWTNLSIEIHQIEPASSDAWELKDDFEMKNFTTVNRLVMRDYYEQNGARDVIEKLANETVLRDEVYLSALAQSLERSNIFFRIRNKRLGIYWERNSKYKQLKEFQAAETI